MFNKLRGMFGGAGRTDSELTTLRSTSDDAGPLIRLERVTKTFVVEDVHTHALCDINLEVERGEFVAVTGPSGSGKSTLLSICGLLDAPSAGTYVLNGHDASRLNARARAMVRNREVGFIFQSFNLIGDLTVFENVELPLTYLGLPPAQRRDRVEAVLERVDMSSRAT